MLTLLLLTLLLLVKSLRGCPVPPSSPGTLRRNGSHQGIRKSITRRNTSGGIFPSIPTRKDSLMRSFLDLVEIATSGKGCPRASRSCTKNGGGVLTGALTMRRALTINEDHSAFLMSFRRARVGRWVGRVSSDITGVCPRSFLIELKAASD